MRTWQYKHFGFFFFFLFCVRSWNGIQLKDFLVDQPEVKEVNWQQKKFSGKASKKKKGKKRGRKKNKKKTKTKSKSKKVPTNREL